MKSLEGKVISTLNGKELQEKGFAVNLEGLYSGDLFEISELMQAQLPRTEISLNGTWDFDQTTAAFPPEKFTRTIPVPGLIHLAEPKIVEYDKFFKRPINLKLKNSSIFITSTIHRVTVGIARKFLFLKNLKTRKG